MTGRDQTLSKVPAVTLGFWVIKILATTLGETGGDTFTMTMKWGYLAGSALFVTALVALVAWQILSKRFHPFLYWATIVASTTAGTTMADFADRSLGIGYAGRNIAPSCLSAHGSWALVLVGAHGLGQHSEHAKGRGVLLGYHHPLSDARHCAWRLDGGRHGPRLCRRRRRFLCGLGTFGCGLLLDEDFQGGPILAAFILTRPLGATVGDFLDKPHDHGGLALSRPIASLVIVALVV